MKRHLKRAHYDENLRVNEYWKKGMPALRIPASGAGRWKGDVLAISHGKIIFELVRRNEPIKCPRCKGSGSLGVCSVCNGKGEILPDKILFSKDEINDVMKLASCIAEKVYPCQVMVFCVAHFVFSRSKGVWITKHLINWDGKDVKISV